MIIIYNSYQSCTTHTYCFIDIQLKSGHPDFGGIRLIGKALTQAEASQKGLPSRLNNKERGELMKAYEDAGVPFLIMKEDAKVQYYPGVSYQVRCSNGFLEVVVKAGDVVEFACESALDRRGFGRLLAVLRHRDYVFFALRWIAETGHTHPRLGQLEFQEHEVFEYSCFHPLTLVDDQKFVGKTFFALTVNRTGTTGYFQLSDCFI